ncbi:hypothetical protein [Palaeococcus pacificus]|uniref:hypothetical protein n=1 Tax=Palaeococcus pacificus TaxID=971279 RepID=UPI000A062089|nr:hypothetical protein [Palaeococcus pacificus]
MMEVLNQSSSMLEAKPGNVIYYETFNVNGYLFKNGSLAGVYAEGELIPIKGENLPYEVHDRILNRKKRFHIVFLVICREDKYKAMIYLENSLERWLIYEKELGEKDIQSYLLSGPGGL